MIKTEKVTEISVILLSNKSKLENLTKSLFSLQKQTLDKKSWELIIIDNNSPDFIKKHLDISWHCDYHCIYEPFSRLLNARIKGINIAKGKLLIFIDTDNLMDSTFLEKTLEISKSNPMIGAWGGSHIYDFENTPPEWTTKYLNIIGCRLIKNNKWTNYPLWDATPRGAGLCIRKNIGLIYAKKIEEKSIDNNSDYKCLEFSPLEDVDLAYTACDEGFGIGLFKDLKIKHIDSTKLLDKKHVLNLLKNFFSSLYILKSKRKNMQNINIKSFQENTSPLNIEFYDFEKKGAYLAENYLYKTGLSKKTAGEIKIDKKDIILITVVRNEMMRISAFLDHHFSLGVNKVFIIDNGSTDGTGDIQKENVYVFHTTEHFFYKPIWIEEILQKYCEGHWSLILDGDELFIYPYYEKLPLKVFCNYLDNSNLNVLHSHLLDMYSGKNLNEITYIPGENLLSAAPYFDPGGYYELKTISLIKAGINYHIYGGMRKRIFDMDVCLSKHPLVKYSSDMKISDGTHNITNARTGSLKGGILHFKYLNDFYNKVLEENRRKVYLMPGEYEIYFKRMEDNNSFFFEGSEKYTNSSRLTELGLLKTSIAFDEYAAGVKLKN